MDGSCRLPRAPVLSRLAARSQTTSTAKTTMAPGHSAPASPRLGLLRSDGRRPAIAPEVEPELFCATIGGLGLTGVIEWIEFQLVPIRSAFLDVEIVPYGSLDEFWSVAEASVGRFEHTVAWIDCLTTGASAGRGVFTRANWSEDGRLDPHDDRTFKSLPFDFPGFALNGLSVAAFNELYYRVHHRKRGESPAALFRLLLSARRDP